MNRIHFLRNPVREYAWGSRRVIPALLGEPVPAPVPAAELWMGAHPLAPSMVRVGGEWRPLDEVIRRRPEAVLGSRVAGRFGSRLPFLFKVLAAEEPLSIQVHPDCRQARDGFSRENRRGIPLDAPERNYRDPNHKPELLVALEPFQCLKGFRPVEEILERTAALSPALLSTELDFLRNLPSREGLRRFFSALLTMDRSRLSREAARACARARENASGDPAFSWMARLHRRYPGDAGVFAPLVLNLLELAPGEGIFIPAGELHAYLYGSGMELMAASDNVLRGGLTSKHVDVPELLKVVDFRSAPVQKTIPVPGAPCERVYPSPAREFVLSVIDVDENRSFAGRNPGGVEILICLEGAARITDPGKGPCLALERGRSVIVPASVARYRMEGTATVYRAAVPFEGHGNDPARNDRSFE